MQTRRLYSYNQNIVRRPLKSLFPQNKNAVKMAKNEAVLICKKDRYNMPKIYKILPVGMNLMFLNLMAINFATPVKDLGSWLLVALLMDGVFSGGIYKDVMQRAEILGKKLKKDGYFNDEQRIIIINKYLKKKGDYVFSPLTRLFYKQKIRELAQVDSKKVEIQTLKNDGIVNPKILKEFSKVGWSEKETIKFIGDLNLDSSFPVEKIIEIASDLYKSTTHFEIPLSNKVKAKIFKNAANPHSDEFDELASMNAKNRTIN